MICYECGEPVVEDTSPGVWIHDPALGDRAYDLNEEHTARPDYDSCEIDSARTPAP